MFRPYSVRAYASRTPDRRAAFLSPKVTNNIAQGETLGNVDNMIRSLKGINIDAVVRPLQGRKLIFALTQGAIRFAYFTLGYYLASLSGTFKDVLRASHTFGI